MYAIISDGCQQYRVEEGQELDIDFRESLSEGEELVIEDVLAISDGENFRVGKPKVDGCTVRAEVLGVIQGDKIVVQKFRRRKNYRKKQGHRQRYTRVRIAKIEA